MVDVLRYVLVLARKRVILTSAPAACIFSMNAFFASKATRGRAGGGTGGANVVYQQDTLAVEVVGINAHVALLVVSAADMHFLTFAYHLDMLEAVDCLALLANTGGETLVPALVGLLTTGRDAHDDGVGQVHRCECPCHEVGSPFGGIASALLEVEQVAHVLLRVEVCTAHVALRGVLHNGVFEHIFEGC